MRTKKESFRRKLSFFVFWLFNLKEHGWGVWGETKNNKKTPRKRAIFSHIIFPI